MLARVSDPPPIALPGHEPPAGSLIAWRKTPEGEREYLVEWVPIISGYRGGLGKPQQTWFPADQVQQIKDEDYSTVRREPDRS